jgi:SAM-dependent MidA family methyltransferase
MSVIIKKHLTSFVTATIIVSLACFCLFRNEIADGISAMQANRLRKRVSEELLRAASEINASCPVAVSENLTVESAETDSLRLIVNYKVRGISDEELLNRRDAIKEEYEQFARGIKGLMLIIDSGGKINLNFINQKQIKILSIEIGHEFMINRN